MFSRTGMLIVAYVLIGIAVGPPPGQQGNLPAFSEVTSASILAWAQFLIWVIAWPAGVIWHHASFTL